ncbi:ribosome hibernation-promoting factor, HPF/YfiA family [Kineococcus rhizosphaerae]|uniref:Ribosome hibernation promoting factor n=1 Tax=Kineococcus rhizosphaerae TaxID=559628 RepID=A0A2T0QZY7_9ACTN|nr:ribosome-associated translation inhibitor RaiA [Kineococcus rhizosphaerae]PRY12452.1 ribosomal subunit interface protein [Kineococcus rhizosphaerae]
MEVVVTGRHTDVKERFRRHVEDKLEKVTQLAPRAQRIDVEVSHESNRRQASSSERVEITVRDKGPVVRAEACADDPYAALDLATTKLFERLRRARDRRKVHHGRHRPTSVHQATAGLSDEVLTGSFDPGRPLAEQVEPDHDAVPTPAVMAGSKPPTAEPRDPSAEDASPVVIREKTHDATPMTLDQALYEMELVGHDFYLFVDAASGTPSVVYRRRGWDYGVIHLEVKTDAPATANGHQVSTDAALTAVLGAGVH